MVMAGSTAVIQPLSKAAGPFSEEEALNSLLTRCCMAAASHDWPRYSACFTSDAVVDFGYCGQIQGQNQIVAAASGIGAPLANMRPSMMNTEFEVNESGSEAAGSANLWYAAGEAPGSRTLEQTAKETENLERINVLRMEEAVEGEGKTPFGGPYRLMFRKETDGWKIKSMELSIGIVNNRTGRAKQCYHFCSMKSLEKGSALSSTI